MLTFLPSFEDPSIRPSGSLRVTPTIKTPRGVKYFEWLTVFGILWGVCFITYSNGLHNGFMWDDNLTFSDVKLKNIKFLPNAFLYPSAHVDKSDTFINSGFYYRPMAYVITLLSYLEFGENPWGYHVLNLFLFAGMCLTVYVFISLFFKSRALAFVTSLLFAAHPINVFFVDYITSGIHSVRFISMLVSLFFFLKALQGGHKYIFYSMSLICFMVALLCHETSIVLPFYIVLVAYYFKERDLKKALYRSWPYWLVLSFYVVFRFLYTGLHSPWLAIPVAPLIYLATFSKIIFLYVSKLFCPQGIVFFWNSPWMTGMNTFIWGMGILVVLIGWGLLARTSAFAISFFCASWLLIGFIPVFLAAFPPYDKIDYGLIIEPQWVTLASVGFFLYFAWVGLHLFARWKKAMLLIFIFLLILLIIISRRHNEIWGDDYRYYFYWSQQIQPLPPVNDVYLGDIYVRKKQYNQARYYYLKALEKKPDAKLFYDLGVIDMGQGLLDQAKKEFLLSVEYNPGFSPAYNNLGVIDFKKGNFKSARELFLRTIQLDKYSIEAHSNLGLICLMQADYRGTVHYYEENLKIVPYDEDSLFGLIQAYTALKDRYHRDQFAQILMSRGKNKEILTKLEKFLQ